MKVGDYVRVINPLYTGTSWYHCIGVITDTWEDMKGVSIKLIKVTNPNGIVLLHKGIIGGFSSSDVEVITEKEALVLVL